MPQADATQIVHTIATETNTPEETVARLYADTLDSYRAEANIQDYLPLFAARKVRATLREKNSKPH
ncbi:DUF3562 domain-containing protein [Paraburkholderia acidipaludis]|uniref:DUF3562 domain-containing protein n=1 Tax=Paraburkholderia acidipaludis TaxID=660537 RepID=UPI0004885E41|nr:DUF3562 domain-containing protein [Paraburkholderia acidipaludis]